MTSQSRTPNSESTPDPPGFEVNDLIIDLAPRRVRRGATVIPLKALTFDLLVTLVRAAPGIVSFDQLTERVWPGLVIAPETITQRVKLLRDALGDDPRAPIYIEGVRGRGYRVVAEVRALTQRLDPVSLVTPSNEETIEEPRASSTQGDLAPTAAEMPNSDRPADSLPALWRRHPWKPLAWISGALIVALLLAAIWAISHYREVTRLADRTSVASTPVIRSLAVLPLENLSGDQEQEYFAIGMTDALTTNLAQIGSLRVISRTSAMHFKGTQETLPQIGRDLQVDAVVEGTVMRGENRVRVTAQLVQASTDRHLWAKTYERDLKDTLALQDEIAQDVAEQIRVTLSPKERSLLIQVRAVDPEAHDAFLRGAYWLSQLNMEAFGKACDYFRKAIAKDPNYALAYVGLARCQDTNDKARETLNKALLLDPSLAEAHSMLAAVKFDFDWDWSGAEAEYRQAISLNPNNALAHQAYSLYLVAMGRLDEAMREAEIARDLDPYSAANTMWLGQVLYHARRYDESLRVNQRGLEMQPGSGQNFYWNMADIYEQKQMFSEAFAARQQSLSLRKDPRVNELREAYRRSGYTGYLLKQAEFEQAHNSSYAAHCYSLLHDEPRAMAALELAYNKHETGILFMRTAPELDFIRSSPGFRDLVRRIGFPPLPPSRDSVATRQGSALPAGKTHD
jgi:TolB-like protein/DNA-binding winged helix-turn-helix (wHTH) protein/Tfp pilus assembly protein PilF